MEGEPNKVEDLSGVRIQVSVSACPFPRYVNRRILGSASFAGPHSIPHQVG